MDQMSKARALYRDYYIDLEEHTQLWRVVAIMHRTTHRRLLPPGFNYAAKWALLGRRGQGINRSKCNSWPEARLRASPTNEFWGAPKSAIGGDIGGDAAQCPLMTLAV
jgi:hypothetical protein